MTSSQFEMVMNMKRKGNIKSIQVLQVLSLIDRSKFVNCRHPYEDKPESIGHNATISPPHMHALVLEYLKDHLVKGNRVLDVGSGSGYLTACMATMVDKAGIVVGIEHVQEILKTSHINISNVLPQALKLGQIFLVLGDGRQGYNVMAPYDAIHIGAAIDRIPKALVDQLKPGGKMFAIIGTGDKVHQTYEIVTKDANGKLTVEEIPACCRIYETLTDVQIQSPKSAGLPANPEVYQPAGNKEKVEVNQMAGNKEKVVEKVEKQKVGVDIPHTPIAAARQNNNHQVPEKSTTITVNGFSYDLKKCLGEGGFGKVYKGIRLTDQRPVAVKVIENIEEWQKPEWSIPEMVHSAHLVTMINHFNVGTTTYLITELLDYDLRRLLKLNGGKLSLENLQSMAMQLAKGYMALFSSDIIHRDIKPENILVEVTKEGAKLKLADFGCGKLLLSIQYAQTYIGTKSYMAWEVFNGRHRYDARADIWSMGLVLYECFFGQHFLSSPHLANIQDVKILSGNSQFDEMLLKMLKLDYRDRMTPLDYFAHPFHASLPHGTLIILSKV